MVRISARFATLCLVLAGLVASASIEASAQTRMPQMKFTDRTLPNGMRVLSAPDSSSPTVAIQVWYHVGSKDDPQSRSAAEPQPNKTSAP
jgi:zinc protease